jgi:hypothetical protein
VWSFGHPGQSSPESRAGADDPQLATVQRIGYYLATPTERGVGRPSPLTRQVCRVWLGGRGRG